MLVRPQLPALPVIVVIPAKMAWAALGAALGRALPRAAVMQAEPELCWQLLLGSAVEVFFVFFLVVCTGGGAPQVTADKAVVVLYLQVRRPLQRGRMMAAAAAVRMKGMAD